MPARVRTDSMSLLLPQGLTSTSAENRPPDGRERDRPAPSVASTARTRAGHAGRRSESCRVAVAVPVAPAGGRPEPLDLLFGQVFARPIVAVRQAASSNCPVFSARCADL